MCLQNIDEQCNLQLDTLVVFPLYFLALSGSEKASSWLSNGPEDHQNRAFLNGFLIAKVTW